MSFTYRVGRFVGEHPLASFGVLLAVLGGMMAMSVTSSREAAKRAAEEKAVVVATAEKQRAAQQAAAEMRAAELAAGCAQTGAFVAKAKAELSRGKPHDAFAAIEQCKPFLEHDAPLRALYVKAMDSSREMTARDHAKAVALAKAEKKRQGVRVGMSQQDALDSSWGRPERVNRTTTGRHTREQWVYGGGNYLYFEDGVLTSISTRN